MGAALVLFSIGAACAASGSKRRCPDDSTDCGVSLSYPGPQSVSGIDLITDIEATEPPARRSRRQNGDAGLAAWTGPGPASPPGVLVGDAESLLGSLCPCQDVFSCADCMAGLYGAADDTDLYGNAVHDDGYSTHVMLHQVGPRLGSICIQSLDR